MFQKYVFEDGCQYEKLPTVGMINVEWDFACSAFGSYTSQRRRGIGVLLMARSSDSKQDLPEYHLVMSKVTRGINNWISQRLLCWSFLVQKGTSCYFPANFMSF